MLLLGLFLLTGAAVDSKVGDWFRNPGPSAVSASMAGIELVSVRANAVTIRVAAEDRPDLSVTLQGGTPGAVKAELIRQGAELQVNLKQPWWHNPYMSEPATVEVQLPASFQAALALDVRTAQVEVRNLTLDSLVYSGQTGALRTEGVQARETDLRQVTGKVELFEHTGALRARLTTGQLEARLAALSGPVTVDLTTGKLVLDLPDDAGFTVTAHVRRGVIHSDLPMAGPNDLRATHGAGTHAIELQVGTGTVDLRMKGGR